MSYITSQNIRLYNLETGENQIVSTTLGTAMDWSPDSQSVLYRDPVIQNGQFVTQLFVYNLTSQTSTNITLDAAYENLSAVWSPDGQWIAAIRRDLSVTQGDQVWLMRADGSQAHALTDQPDEAYGNLNWSPDGQYLLYDVYLFDSVSLERKIEIIEVDAGRITYPGINGYNAKWVTAK